MRGREDDREELLEGMPWEKIKFKKREISRSQTQKMPSDLISEKGKEKATRKRSAGVKAPRKKRGSKCVNGRVTVKHYSRGCPKKK